MSGRRAPLVVSCRGASKGAHLAGALAAALGELGVAEPAGESGALISRARAGREVVALDGCPSACCARELQARGVSPALALNLVELGIDTQHHDTANVTQTHLRSLAGEIAARIRRRQHAGRQRRAPRPARPQLTPQRKRTHAVNDYLLAIDALASTVLECGALGACTPTLAAHVSLLLGVSRVTAGEMLDRIEGAGLIERGAHRELTLTASGRLQADRVLRRHRLLERMAGDYLGYPPAEVYEQARALDQAFDEEAIERVRRALGDPERCPHGWPIDPRSARAESRELSTLTTLQPEGRAIVARLVEQDGPAIAQLHELGLLPGAAVELLPVHAPEVLRVNVAGEARTLHAKLAGKALVRRAQDEPVCHGLPSAHRPESPPYR